MLRLHLHLRPLFNQILQSPQGVQRQIELAITVGAGELFVKCTYNLEEDGQKEFLYDYIEVSLMLQ